MWLRGVNRINGITHPKIKYSNRGQSAGLHSLLFRNSNSYPFPSSLGWGAPNKHQTIISNKCQNFDYKNYTRFYCTNDGKNNSPKDNDEINEKHEEEKEEKNTSTLPNNNNSEQGNKPSIISDEDTSITEEITESEVIPLEDDEDIDEKDEVDEKIPPTPPNTPDLNTQDSPSGEILTPKMHSRKRGGQIITNPHHAPMARIKMPAKVPIFPFSRRPIFPGVLTPMIFTNKTLSAQLLARREKGQHFVGVFLTKDIDPNNKSDSYNPVSDPTSVETIGVLARVERLIVTNSAKGEATVMLQGITRIKIISNNEVVNPISISTSDEQHSETNDEAQVQEIVEHQVVQVPDLPYDHADSTIRAYTAEIVSTMKEIVKLNPFFKEQLQIVLDYIDLSSAGQIADLAACLTTSDTSALQDILNELDVIQRLSKALNLLKKELEVSTLQMKITKQLDGQIQQNQRKYFLTEQLKIIKKELGIETDEKEALIEKFNSRLSHLKVTENVQKVIDEEITKLSFLEPSSSEFNVTRNYLEWVTTLPWGIFHEDNLDVAHAQRVLDEDHYGLADIKERILEFIAVAKLKGSLTGKILCFVGPPGTGKTSIGKSIARALSREFFRFSVGGMSDVAEIKGHRRTYVGAMPGKLIQALKRLGSSNPVVLLDEVDKIGKGGYQGDPASALLEVLDPEQNKDFLDHYLDIPFDLSKVLFICTANVIDTIPGPLLDRMEVLRLSGYVNEEKISISKNYLIPAARKETGVLEREQGVITESALKELVQHYCRESGVRNLQKHIEKIFRKIAFKISEGETNKMIVNSNNLAHFVGKRAFPKDLMYEETPVGVVTGLAWTAMGGATLFIETAISPNTAINAKKSKKVEIASSDRGSLFTTGQLGDVMKESTTIAYSFVKLFLHRLATKDSKYTPFASFFETNSLHMHVPEGATPKDGPSAGITMATSLISLAIQQNVRPKLAMTGELSLTGLVLAIGGVKEKVLAARRSNIQYIIFPKANYYDWEELEGYLKEGMRSFFVEKYEDVFKIAFGTDEELIELEPKNKSFPLAQPPSEDPEL